MLIPLLLVVVAVIFFGIIVIFASPRLSPIPYFPSNAKDLSLILKGLDVQDNQIVFDLGAGDGIIIFAAAADALQKKRNTKFVAVEVNPVLALIMHIRRWGHPNRENIRIVWGDMFKLNVPKYISANESVTIYIYVSPRFIPPIKETVSKAIAHYKFVSYFYPIETGQKATHSGIHDVFISQI